jgi:late competence protein required for DNA uptake (superfamily II DNA/RNA helicase)
MQFDCDKDKRIVELCQDNLKIVIVARYNLQLEKYFVLLKDKFPLRPIYIINGQTKDRADIVKKINSDQQCIVLSQASLGEGYSLETIDTMVFASLTFGYVNYFQMTQRIKNMKKKTPVTYIHLISRGTGSVDRAVKRAIEKGEDFNTAIYDKTRTEVHD